MRWKSTIASAPSGRMAALSLILSLALLESLAAAQSDSLSVLSTMKSLTSVRDVSSKASAADKMSSASEPTGVDVSLTSSISMSSMSASSQQKGAAIFHLSDLPTIAGASIPTQVVPYTAPASFMQKSSLPQGTVFIIVGSVLGFFGMCVLAWRGLVALSLARSVKRAALAHQETFDRKKSAYVSPSGGMYTHAHDSSNSMERLTSALPVKSSRRKSQGPSRAAAPSDLPSSTSGSHLPTRASTTNLFFSPTAGAGHNLVNLPTNRSSTFLPAGYYASGTTAPAGGTPTTHINAHAAAGGARVSSILNPLSDRLHGVRAESGGYQRTQSFGVSPPGSPDLRPTHAGGGGSMVGNVGLYAGGGAGQQSQSSLNLNAPGSTTNGGRTPSALLDDLFEEHGNGPRRRW